jgi:hypothetical protein
MTGAVLTDGSRELRFLVDTQGRQHAVLIEPHGPGNGDNLADLLPGLSAFRLRPEMLASAREVWQGWAAAGSPELAAAVDFELARSNNLQDYANLDFETWFAGLQPAPPMFADGFE